MALNMPIECYHCGEWCGTSYSATHEDPGFDEGPGEDYADEEGNWHCSQECLNATLSDQEDEDEDW